MSERLAKREPTLLVSPIPGPGERHADYLLESGAAVEAVDVATLVFKPARLPGERTRLASMGEAAHRIARPCAARDVIRLTSTR